MQSRVDLNYTPDITACTLCNGPFRHQISTHYLDNERAFVKTYILRAEFKDCKMCEFFQKIYETVEKRFLPTKDTIQNQLENNLTIPQDTESIFYSVEMDTFSLRKCGGLQYISKLFEGKFLRVKLECYFNTKLNRSSFKYEVVSLDIHCLKLNEIH